MIGIYHNRDLDGFTSGAIIKKKYPEAEMRGYDYGEPFDFSGMEGNEVIMADVSLPMKDMIKISKLTNGRFTWIDHHISAIKDFEALNDYTILAAVLDNTIAACEGAWNYLFHGEDMPYAVKLLGEYDTWRNQDVDRWNNEILPFQFGMRVHCNSVKSFPTNIFSHNEFVPGYISDGKLILKYNTIQNENSM
jgi:oligoribonuclease NrnB/cAMP/cGMP phosphodiesterase (DHH superfamily)